MEVINTTTVSTAEARQFHALNPATGQAIPDLFTVATEKEIEFAVVSANDAFLEFKKVDSRLRAKFLETIATEIDELGDSLIRKCMEETGLPEGRVTSERQRTINQLKLFAELIHEGSWVNARIDTPQPHRVPIPRSDIRQMQVPLGPVCVFEASNFPLAFSTAGGDTASALAAGCTVVVKSHSNHPGTSELVASAIKKAIAKTGMPKGTFSLVHGPGKEVGVSLVANPLIKAVGFTGSFSGGMALVEAAGKRKEPIPVYAEMGSVNPVFILPEACRIGGQQLAAKLVDSITLGSGQFCTNPGLIVMLDTDYLPVFLKAAQERMLATSGTPMLSLAIKESYDKGVDKFLSVSVVSELGRGKDGGMSLQGIPRLMMTSAQGFMRNRELSEELFGPSSLLVIAEDKGEVLGLAKELSGQLTATIHGTRDDLDQYSDLVEIVEQKAGRIIMNGVPTGVEVCHSMVHGGPFPATSDSRSTSVGTLAIYRFTRPVCYQDFSQKLLPMELQDENPRAIMRLVNGLLTKDRLS